MDKTQLSIVVAVYNESDNNLRSLIERLETVLKPESISYELIFVNDGSSEQTSVCLDEIARNIAYVQLINLSRNFGQQAAITAGIDLASGQAIITMDSDLQDPSEVIPNMVRLWQNGFDVVYARRSSRKDRLWKRLTAFLFYRSMSLLSSIHIPPDTGEFRLIDRQVATALKQLPERTRYIRGLIPWLGFRQTSIPIDRIARHHGESSYTLQKLIALAFDGLLSFSFVPLYVISVIGIIIILGSCLLPLLWVIHWKHHVTLFIWSISGFLFISGLQVFLLGLLGLYIAKILDEVRARPVYITAKTTGRAITTDSTTKNQSKTDYNGFKRFPD